MDMISASKFSRARLTLNTVLILNKYRVRRRIEHDNFYDRSFCHRKNVRKRKFLYSVLFLKVVYLIKFVSLGVYARGKLYVLLVKKGHVRKAFGNCKKATVIYLSSRVYAKILLVLAMRKVLREASAYRQRMTVFTANSLELSHKFESLVKQAHGLIKEERRDDNNDRRGYKHGRIANREKNRKSHSECKNGKNTRCDDLVKGL